MALHTHGNQPSLQRTLNTVDDAYTVPTTNEDVEGIGESFIEARHDVGMGNILTSVFRRCAEEVIEGENERLGVIRMLKDHYPPVVVPPSNTIEDVDGNVYTYVTIGTQQWLTTNLKTTKYADGTAIPNLTLAADWIAEDGTGGHDGAYCAYDNDEDNVDDYGYLYNWYAVDNAHGLAPTGWRVPNDTDWQNFYNTMSGGVAVAGSILKEAGITHWQTPNTGAIDSLGLSFVAGGNRSPGFTQLTEKGTLWSSTNTASVNEFNYNRSDVVRFNPPKWIGYSVRCMRDI